MEDYRRVLKRFVATDFGGGSDERSTTADNLLRQDIQNVIRSDEKYFKLCVIIVLLLFVGSVVITVMNLGKPLYISGIFSATGISYAFLLRQMIGLWREKSKAEVAYNLAMKLPPEDLKAVISILLTEPK
jgi:hypothetical protein